MPFALVTPYVLKIGLKHYDLRCHCICWRNDDIKESNLRLGNIDSSTIHQIADCLLRLSFKIPLRKQFLEKEVCPFPAGIPLLSCIRDICQMKHHLECHHFVLLLRFEVKCAYSCLEFAQLAKVLRHISCEDALYHQLSSSLVVFLTHALKDVQAVHWLLCWTHQHAVTG